MDIRIIWFLSQVVVGVRAAAFRHGFQAQCHLRDVLAEVMTQEEAVEGARGYGREAMAQWLATTTEVTLDLLPPQQVVEFSNGNAVMCVPKDGAPFRFAVTPG